MTSERGSEVKVENQRAAVDRAPTNDMDTVKTIPALGHLTAEQKSELILDPEFAEKALLISAAIYHATCRLKQYEIFAQSAKLPRKLDLDDPARYAMCPTGHIRSYTQHQEHKTVVSYGLLLLRTRFKFRIAEYSMHDWLRLRDSKLMSILPHFQYIDAGGVVEEVAFTEDGKGEDQGPGFGIFKALGDRDAFNEFITKHTDIRPQGWSFGGE